MEEILNRSSYFNGGSIPTCYSCCWYFFSRVLVPFFPPAVGISFMRSPFTAIFWRTFSYFFYRWNSISGFFKSIVFPFLVSLQRFFVPAIPPLLFYFLVEFFLPLFFFLFILKFSSPLRFFIAEILPSSFSSLQFLSRIISSTGVQFKFKFSSEFLPNAIPLI